MDSGAENYRRFLGGDDDGLADIIREYQSGLFAFLKNMVRDETTAEELTEETFVRVGIRKPRFSGQSSFQTWLYAIGRHAALDHLRKRPMTEALPLEDCGEIPDLISPEIVCLRDEDKAAVRRAMTRLKPAYRQVLWLIYFEGFTVKETARIMKKSVHATENLASRARQALKAELTRVHRPAVAGNAAATLNDTEGGYAE